jgi:hypothetical protein
VHVVDTHALMHRLLFVEVEIIAAIFTFDGLRIRLPSKPHVRAPALQLIQKASVIAAMSDAESSHQSTHESSESVWPPVFVAADVPHQHPV